MSTSMGRTSGRFWPRAGSTVLEVQAHGDATRHQTHLGGDSGDDGSVQVRGTRRAQQCVRASGVDATTPKAC